MFTWTILKGLCLWFVVGGFRCVFFIYCVARFVACDRPVSGYNRLVRLEDFLFFLVLVTCKNKAMSVSFPRQKFHSTSRFPSPFSILFLRAKLGERVQTLWFALTPPLLKWEKPKIPSKIAKRAARHNEFGSKSMAMDSVSFLSLRNSFEFLQYLF